MCLATQTSEDSSLKIQGTVRYVLGNEQYKHAPQIRETRKERKQFLFFDQFQAVVEAYKYYGRTVGGK